MALTEGYLLSEPPSLVTLVLLLLIFSLAFNLVANVALSSIK